MENEIKEKKQFVNVEYTKFIDSLQSILRMSEGRFHNYQGRLFERESEPQIRQNELNEFCSKEILEVKTSIENVLSRFK